MLVTPNGLSMLTGGGLSLTVMVKEEADKGLKIFELEMRVVGEERNQGSS